MEAIEGSNESDESQTALSDVARHLEEPNQILEKVEPNEKESSATLKVQKEMYSGPLPHPSHLKEYEECYPGAAEEIIKMAVKQSDHRQDMEKRYLVIQEQDMINHYKHSGRGMLFGFILSLIFLVGGIVLIALDKSASGLILISTVIIGLVGLFMSGRKSSKNNEEKATEEETVEEDSEE